MSYDGECRFLGSLSDILTEAEATRLRNYYATAFRKRLEVHFPDPESFPHDLHDDLIQQAFTEHLAALKQGKLPSKKIIVTRVWTEHWRKERREERSRVASLDDPVTVADGEDAEVQDLVGTSDLARLVPLLLDEDALCIWDAIARVGPNWKAIGAELGCDWRTAKKRVCDVLFPSSSEPPGC